jgi:8-oxo-dGTP pyrophosphatase MutT (NUDIX family)
VISVPPAPLQLLEASDPRLAPGGGLSAARDAVLAVPDGSEELEAARRRILEWAARHSDALERSCLEGHLTASALVVDAPARRIVLLHHAKLRRWLQPGGHADGEGNLAAGALREATEETGIEGLRVAVPAVDLDVHLVSPPVEGPHLHLDVRYLVVAPPGAELRGNHESTDLRWVDPDDLDGYEVDGGLRRLVTAGMPAARRLVASG